MNMKKNYILLAILFLNSYQTSLKAQNILQCATDENIANKVARNPELMQKLMDSENLIQDFIFNTSRFSNNNLSLSYFGIFCVEFFV